MLEDAGFEIAGVAGDATDLVRKASAHKPDVVVADIQMPPDHTDDGLRAAQQIRATLPDIGVVILSQYLEAAYALELVGDRAERVGYLLKQRVSDLALFTEAIRRVARGGLVLDPQVVARMVARPRAAGPFQDLTPREREVLALMAEGRSNAAIAGRLFVTVGRSRTTSVGSSTSSACIASRMTIAACWPSFGTPSAEGSVVLCRSTGRLWG